MSGRLTERQIAGVQREVNGSIRYRSDLSQYGMLEKWVADPASGEGDCEDYALTKRLRLLALGAALEDVAIVVGTAWGGEPHAVCYALDDAGRWWVLDNMAGRPERPTRSGFRPGPGPLFGPPPGAHPPRR